MFFAVFMRKYSIRRIHAQSAFVDFSVLSKRTACMIGLCDARAVCSHILYNRYKARFVLSVMRKLRKNS